jgi:cytochrome P450
MQLRIAWEEILKRFSHIEVVGEPERTLHAFVKGYTAMNVKLHAK